MTFRHLTIFLMVCEEGSMTRAARRLYITQPSVSQAIAELERFYGARLFERLNRRLVITAAGERLRAYAYQILNLAEQARQELTDLETRGVLRIGASLTIGAYVLPGLVARFHRLMPDIEIYAIVDNTHLIEQRILDDRLDLGMVEGPVHSPHILEEAMSEDELVLVCAPGHPLAQRETVALGDLAGQPFIIREEGSGTREIFELAMQSAGVRWKAVGVMNNNDAIQNAVRENLGLSVMSRLAIQADERQGRIVALAVQGLALKRKFNWIYHRQKYVTTAMQQFRASFRATPAAE